MADKKSSSFRRPASKKSKKKKKSKSEKLSASDKVEKKAADDPRPRATIMSATLVAPNLFVGTRDDAEALGERVPDDWVCISVTEFRSRYRRTEELPYEPIGSLDLPFMADSPNGWYADPHKLDLIAEIISLRLAAGKKVLVHCIAGQERAPLAAAWYLTWSGSAPSMQSAYETIIELHPRTERRDAWLREFAPATWS
jgi:hypothetical protein